MQESFKILEEYLSKIPSVSPPVDFLENVLKKLKPVRGKYFSGKFLIAVAGILSFISFYFYKKFKSRNITQSYPGEFLNG